MSAGEQQMDFSFWLLALCIATAWSPTSWSSPHQPCQSGRPVDLCCSHTDSGRAEESVAWQKLISSNYSWALKDYSQKPVSSEVKTIGMVNIYCLLEEIWIHLRDKLWACL